MSIPAIGATAAGVKGVADAAAKKKKEKENEKFKMRKAARRTAKTLSPAQQETKTRLDQGSRRRRAARRAELFPGLSRAEVSAKRAEKGKGKSAPSPSTPTPTKTLKPGARQRKANRMKKGIGRYAK